MARFSKQSCMDAIDARMRRLEEEHKFHSGQGYAAVEDKPFKTVLAFGEYSALRDLWEDIRDSYL